MPPPASPHDERTVERAYSALSARLRQFIRRRVPADADADDILQEVFLKIHERSGSVRDSARLEQWIYQVTRNAIIDYYRSRTPLAPLPPEGLAALDGDGADAAVITRLSASIRRMIGELPDIYRDALLLTEYQGLSQQELAAQMGISLSGAKSRVQRARAMLKDLLMKCCHFELDRYGTVIDYHPRSCSTCCAGAQEC